MKKCLAFLAVLVVLSSIQVTAQTITKKKIVAGEQAPPANPGQNNFGGPRPAVGTQGQRPPVMQPRLIVHHVEGNGPRKPLIYEVDDSGDKLILGQKYNP
jgi:hypothetical protein